MLFRNAGAFALQMRFQVVELARTPMAGDGFLRWGVLDLDGAHVLFLSRFCLSGAYSNNFKIKR